MFDDVHFTGTVNLGNLVNSLVVLIGVISLYIKIKAEIASHEKKTGEKIETSIRKRLIRPKKVSKPVGKVEEKVPPGDQGDDN